MRCEIVAVGTELLLGQIVDTNSSWIGEQLALVGIDSHFQTKVGDNAARIESALRIALDRSDAVIVCGGLGPTHDDITRDVIADVMGVELRTDPEIADRIRAMFGSRGRDMPDNNLRQAQVPEGAWTMEQQPGTAPGLVCPIGDPETGQVIYAVPGVPYEMKEMVEGTVLPDLQRRAGVEAVIRSRTLRTWGHSESGLAELLAGRIEELDASGTATIAFLASGMEGLKVRVTAKAETGEEADRILADEVDLIGELLGEVVFSTNDESMEEVVLQLLPRAGPHPGHGRVRHRRPDRLPADRHPGRERRLPGSVVSYASEVKFDVLGVPRGPVVSDDAAIAMAEGACRVLGADVAISVTGVAGPEPQEGVPVGTVYLGLCIDGEAESIVVRLPGDRARVRQFSTISVLDWLRRRLLAQGAPEPW